jgi:hypothetical protein
MPKKLFFDPCVLRDLVETQKLQLRIVAQKLNTNEETIRKYCNKFGIKRQRTGPRGGELHPDWKGGTKISKGYRYIYQPDHPFRRHGNYVLEHRLVMEQKLGRYLHPKEVVHHIDGNRLNNVPENLIVFGSNGEHLRHELMGKCPKWTPEGFAKMCRAGGRFANPLSLKPGESRQPQ